EESNSDSIYSTLALNVCSPDFSERPDLAVTVNRNGIRFADDVNRTTPKLGVRKVEAIQSGSTQEGDEGTSNTQQELAAENHDDALRQMHVCESEFNEERGTKEEFSNELKSLEHTEDSMAYSKVKSNSVGLGLLKQKDLNGPSLFPGRDISLVGLETPNSGRNHIANR
ncbi:hypothetical protein Ancab_025406, partial [Ancistrocladus abbreviatus]